MAEAWPKSYKKFVSEDQALILLLSHPSWFLTAGATPTLITDGVLAWVCFFFFPPFYNHFIRVQGCTGWIQPDFTSVPIVHELSDHSPMPG